MSLPHLPFIPYIFIGGGFFLGKLFSILSISIPTTEDQEAYEVVQVTMPIALLCSMLSGHERSSFVITQHPVPSDSFTFFNPRASAT